MGWAVPGVESRTGQGSPETRYASSDRQTLIVNSWSAASYELGFGKHKGKTLSQIGETDEGLAYIVWMAHRADRMRPTTRLAARAYLDLPSVVKRVNALFNPNAAKTYELKPPRPRRPRREADPVPRVQACDAPFEPGSFPYRIVG